ncbi:hypothetical protein V6N12_055189 [Hibiscus sabdariffa]|uniref:Uncharacterized protein n=1 Tax=Hibiscus sabdariffa TaxID=183260 RepID=A0ABR1ZNC4_9ROSI
MHVAGMEWVEIMSVVGSMVPPLFPDVESRQAMLSKEKWVYLIVVQEAELVCVPVVENKGMVMGADSYSKSWEGSMGSYGSHMLSKMVRVVSPCWRVNQLWGLKRVASAEQVGLPVRVVCNRGGVVSDRDEPHAVEGDRSWEDVVNKLAREVVAVSDSNTLERLADTQ